MENVCSAMSNPSIYTAPRAFTRDLDVRAVGSHEWVLLSEFDYHVGRLGSSEIITVPAGFVTDFASIPRPFWTLIGHPAGAYRGAAVVHDWLYFNQGEVDGRVYTRKRCDQIFEEAMRVLGVGQPRRWLMYQAVRMGGRGAWND